MEGTEAFKLDEFSQLIYAMVGDISFVGTRPEAVDVIYNANISDEDKRDTVSSVIESLRLNGGVMNKKKTREILQSSFHVAGMFYIVVILVILPLFMGNGYYELAEYKYRVFLYGSLIFLAVCLILLLCYVIKIVRNKKFLEMIGAWKVYFDKITLVSIVLIGYLIINSLYSIEPRTAFWGYHGWYMGNFTYILCILCFLILRWGDWNKQVILYIAVFVAMIVCLLGYTQRIGVNYVTEIGYVEDNAYLSTMGQINWMAGYFTLAIPVMAYLFLKLKNDFRLIYGLILLCCMGFLTIQGSESCYIILGCVMFGFFVWTLYNGEDFLDYCYFEVVTMVGILTSRSLILSSLANGSIRTIFGLSNLLNSKIWNVLAIIGCFAIAGYYFLNKKKKWKEVPRKRVALGLCICFVLMVCGGVTFFCLVNIFPENFSRFSQNYYFNFNPDWGTTRGGIWMLTYYCFQRGSLFHKLFGIGADCLAHSIDMYYSDLPQWGVTHLELNLMPTNSHNEVFNSILCWGILGSVLYYLYWLYMFIDQWKRKGFTQEIQLACVMLFTFFMHNLVSFHQILNLPILFVLCAVLFGERVNGATKDKK